MLFEDAEGWQYHAGQLEGRSQPAIYRTMTGKALEVLGYFRTDDAMWTFIEGLASSVAEALEVELVADGIVPLVGTIEL